MDKNVGLKRNFISQNPVTRKGQRERIHEIKLTNF